MTPSPSEQQLQTIAGREVDACGGVAHPGWADQLEVEFRSDAATKPEPLSGPRRLDAPSRMDVDPEPHRPLDDGGKPKQFVATGGGAVGKVRARPQRQGVSEPNQTGCCAHLRHEHSGVGRIELPGLEQALRSDGEGATPRGVEDPTEQRRRIEARDTQPRDGAVATDEGGGRAVPDEAVVLDRQVAIFPVKRPEHVHARSVRGYATPL